MLDLGSIPDVILAHAVPVVLYEDRPSPNGQDAGLTAAVYCINRPAIAHRLQAKSLARRMGDVGQFEHLEDRSCWDSLRRCKEPSFTTHRHSSKRDRRPRTPPVSMTAKRHSCWRTVTLISKRSALPNDPRVQASPPRQPWSARDPRTIRHRTRASVHPGRSNRRNWWGPVAVSRGGHPPMAGRGRSGPRR